MPALATASRRPRPSPPPGRAHALDERRPAWKAGLVGTVIAHVIVGLGLILMPRDILEVDRVASEAAANRSFEIELNAPSTLPDTLSELVKRLPEPKDERVDEAPDLVKAFIPINPDAPENRPDKTSFVSNQDQQAAQPDATFAGNSPVPVVQTDELDPGLAIVTGTLFKQRVSIADQFEGVFHESKEDQSSAASPEAKLRVDVALSEKVKEEKGEGSAQNATISGEGGRAEVGKSPQQGVEGGKPDGEGYFAKTPKIDRSRPMPRPRLRQQALPEAAPFTLTRNLKGAGRIGVIAADARWTDFGDYYGRMWDSIALEWERNITDSKFLPTPGVEVQVKVILNSRGEIEEIVDVSGEASVSTQYLCVSAITNRAPFGKWTPSMVDVLGDKTELIFGFRF